MRAVGKWWIVICLILVFAHPLRGQNLIVNPGFEEDKGGLPAGWGRYAHQLPKEALKALTRDTQIAHTGNASARISVRNLDKPRSLCWVSPSFSVEPGKWLFASVWVRSENFGGQASFCYWFGTKEGNRITQIGGALDTEEDGVWVKRSFSVQVPPGAAIAKLDLAARISTGTVWFDDLSVNVAQDTILPSAVYKRDFGVKDSQRLIGFRQATGEDSYDVQKGYGWRGKRTGMVHAHRGPDGAIASWAPVNPDPLCYDFVYAEDAAFELNLPNGEYEAVLIVGDIGNEALGVRSGYSVAVQGRTVVNVAGLDEESFRHWLWKYGDDDWQPGYDVWDRYIAPRFCLHRFSVPVKDGKLSLSFRTCPVNMLAVYRAADRGKIDGEMKELDEMRRAFFPYREIKYPDHRPFPALTDEERGRGYLVFVKHYLDEVFPDTVPQREEIRSEVEAFAAGNQYEPVTFAIRALQDMQGVKVSPSDLVSEKGARIPRTDVDVQFVRYVEIAMAGPTKGFRVCPHILMKRESVGIPKGTNKWVWLTTHVRKGTTPGLYQGEITVAPRGKRASQLRMLLEVLPFDLPERVKDKYYAILANWPPPSVYGDVWDRYAMQFPVLKAHGMETLYVAGGPFKPKARCVAGKVEITDAEFLDKTMALYRSAGFSENRVLWNTAFDLLPLAKELAGGDEARKENIYRQLLQAIDERAKRRGWPAICFMNNSSDGATPEEQLPRAKLVKSAGVKVWDQQGNPKTINAIADFTDLFLIHPPEAHRKNFIANIRGKGKEVGFMNYGLCDIFFGTRLRPRALMSGAYRFYWGWWFWHGAQVMGDEFHEVCWYGQPYNSFDGTLGEAALNDFSGVASPSPTGPRPHLRYEWMREGRDDMRYIALLEELIGRANAGNCPEAKRKAAAAEQFLENVGDSINIEAYNTYSASSPWWPLEKYDRQRRAAASYVVDLLRLLSNRK